MYVVYQTQTYVIKSTAIKYDGVMISNEVTAKHIFMEFQNHYIDKDVDDEQMNSDNEDSNNDEAKPTYTLQQYLDFGFKGNKLGFTFVIKGTFKERVAVDELGNKTVWSI